MVTKGHIPMKSLRTAVVAVLLAGALVVGCTAAQQALAKTIVDDTGSVCETVFVAVDPTLAPLCTTASTIATAIESLIASHTTADAGAADAAPTAARKAGTTAPAAYVPSNAEIYGWLVAHGAHPVKISSLPQQ